MIFNDAQILYITNKLPLINNIDFIFGVVDM